MCKQCRDEHLKSPENRNHEVVLYQQHKQQQCKIHPTKDIDMLCEECQVDQYSKSDIAILLGEIHVLNTKAEMREIRPMESAHNAAISPTHKQMKEDREISDKTQTRSLSASVTKLREFILPGVSNAHHISLDQLDRLWISDSEGNLVQTDLQGNKIQEIKTSGGSQGYHTVTQGGDLVFTDKDNKVINRITQDNNITQFMKTGNWTPLSIHSSHINGDILVGMKTVEEDNKVIRYNKTGKELQNIQWNNKGEELYGRPDYITENTNGDICTSDYIKGVVVVDKSGKHRFSYKSQESNFRPFGICTDVLCHILVCYRNYSNTVHILDQDGQFLSLLHIQQGVEYPRCMCIDGENNLYMGQAFTNTLTVFKYFQ
ncbi:uncharacterized protein LOC133174601 [Saccostrea echinata]|uniref:uncharacterized protein LOC133174601 n=1 Tax=Saccostrea echinata TaxID=191078 RepID=UPI002A7EE397|nr:uncharacterized protein LOC133174601 [Saccostrea echinata]